MPLWGELAIETVSSTTMELLTGWVFGLAGIVAALAVALLIQHGVTSLTRAYSRGRKAVLAPLAYRLLEGSGDEAELERDLRRFDRGLVRGLLLELALDLRGDSGQSISSLYKRLGLLGEDIARLQAWRPSRRARAAADLGLVGHPSALAPLLNAIGDPDIYVRQAAVCAVGRLADPASLSVLIDLLGDPADMVACRAQEVLAERGREVEERILDYARRNGNRRGRLAAVELLGWLRVGGATELLIELMHHSDIEIRIKSVKAAAAIGDPRFLPAFHEGLGDSEWEVRCQAAKGLGALGSPASVAHLEKVLRDNHWWVRFHAAVALAEVGGHGRAALGDALFDPQPLVRDMARYLVERGRALPVLP